MAIRELLSQITPINLGPIYDVKNLVIDVLVSASLRGHKSDKEELNAQCSWVIFYMQEQERKSALCGGKG